jgi:hypothetical protein
MAARRSRRRPPGNASTVDMAGSKPIGKLEAALKCRLCKKRRYAPPVHMIKLTLEREIKPCAARMGHGLALRKFNGGDRPLAVVAPDRDSQTVMLVKPNLLHGPGLSIGEDYGLADKLSLGLIERAEDR